MGAARGLLEVKRSTVPLPADTAETVLAALVRLTEDGVPPSIPVMQEGFELLRSAGASKVDIDGYRKRCKLRCPLATVFDEKGVKLNGHVNGNGMDN